MTESALLQKTGLIAELRYLALGDSYTIGEGVTESGRWPAQLAQTLRMQGIPMSDPRFIARTGWSCDELDAAIDAVRPLAEYDLVSLLIGVNDQYRGRPVEGFRVRFARLLERAVGFAQWRREHVLALSIPDWGATPFAATDARGAARISAEIDAYNAAAAELCAQREVAFVDLTALTRAHGADPQMLVEDGLHPSAAMYAQWTRLAAPVVRAMEITR
jgi:lysophospholipase L1-like esterase